MERMKEMMNTRQYTIQIATTVAILMVSWPVGAQENYPTRLSLSHALELAGRNNPVLEVARYRIAEAQGDLIGASVLLVNNPELVAGAGPRLRQTPEAETTLDIEVGLKQRFEIGGQRAHRIDRANAQTRAAQAAAEDARRVVELAVTSTFYDALAANRRVEIRDEGQQLAQRLLDVATRRLNRGAGTPLELNTARIRRAEAQRRAVAARAASRSALLRLRQLLALPEGRAFALQGDLPDARLNQQEDALVARALERRPDLHAAEHRVEAAQAAVELADAEAWPDISVGVSFGMEEGSNIVLGGLRIPLPIFNRNQGRRARTRATVGRLQAERTGRRLVVESEVRRAYTGYAQARDALRIYDDEVLRAQEESLGLLQRAFEAGEVGYADVIVVQREVLEGREGLVDVRLGYARARARALSSSGLPQTSRTQGENQ